MSGVRHYDAVTKPALRAFRSALVKWERELDRPGGHDPRFAEHLLTEAKAQCEAAAEVGASRVDLRDHAGGYETWNRFARAVQRTFFGA